MAFWGVEVKPGKPVTHAFDRVRGRLRISQATLGLGTATSKSIVQCNIGDKTPILLCALLPDKSESCHLDLMFEEDNEVVFSVLGPRSVYLTGYFVGNVGHSNLIDDDTESCGEDIANTETDKSVDSSNEDGYEDSFIDDTDDKDEEFFSPSAVSSEGVDRVILDEKLPQASKRNGKRLKKKHLIESDDDSVLLKQKTTNDHGIHSESEDDLNFTLSGLKSKQAVNKKMFVAEDDAVKLSAETSDKKTEDDDTCIDKTQENAGSLVGYGQSEVKLDQPSKSMLPPDQVNQDLVIEPTMESQLLEEKITNEDDIVGYCKGVKEAETHQDDVKAKTINPDLLVCNEDQRLGNDNGVGPENGIKLKKKRKKQSKDMKICEADRENSTDRIANELQPVLEGAKNVVRDVLLRNEDSLKPASDMKADYQQCSRLSSVVDSSENGPKPKKIKKDQAVDETCVESNVDQGWSKHDGVETENMDEDLRLVIDYDQKKKPDRSVGTHCEQSAEGDQPDEKKRRKKKNKKGENEVNMDTGEIFMSKEEKEISSLKFVNKSADGMSTAVRTLLSGGLIIEQLKKGEPDGKIAEPGKKVKVYYTGKFKENGQIFDSNVDKAPFKFCLGDESIIKGWNAGLDGMQVGEKRRLTIPPSLGYGSSGAGENVPPNSWLVYDVELVSVRR